MAESPDIARLRDAFDALARGNLDATLDVLSPDLVIDDHTVPEDTTGPRGPDALSQLLNRLREAFDDYRLELRDLTDLGHGRFLAIVRTSGTGHGSQIEMGGEVGEIFVVRDGLVVRGDIYPSSAEARQAAGLEE
jgi:ketosteroid isomerase-like protein